MAFNGVIANRLNPWAWLRVLSNNDLAVLCNAGAPTSGTSGTFAKKAGPGTLLLDYTNKVVYLNTNTKASPTWTAIGPSTSLALARGFIFRGNSSGVAAAYDANDSGKILVGDGTDLNSVAVTGDVTISSAGVTAIGANKVLSSMLDTGIIQKVTGTISSANITGTSAGQFGHANGVVLQAAPGASVALQPVALGMYYTFATAAYTAGGNITLNWGAGGAALTGLVSAANSVGAASSKAVMFFPLSTAGIAIVSNASLNLVSSAAFTQPGTAAGTIAWELWYRTMAVGF